MKKAFFLICILALAGIAQADVGVVVEFPNGTVYTECVSVSDGSSGYQALEKTDLDIGWSSEGIWGRALCNINDVGPETDGDGCKWGSEYWGLFLSLNGTSWKYSPVGFSGAGGCWNRDMESFDGHYCVQDGDMIGLAYGEYGSKPPSADFYDICAPEKPEKKERIILRSSEPYWMAYSAACGIEYSASLAPQNIADICDKKKAALLVFANGTNLSTTGNSTGNSTGRAPAGNSPDLIAADFSSVPTCKKGIDYTYYPHVMSGPGQFKVVFTNCGDAIPGLNVSVNGNLTDYNANGSAFFDVALGNYLVEASAPGYGRIRLLFKIGG